MPHFKKAFFQTILCFGRYQQYSTALPDVSTSLRRTSVNLIDKTRLPDEEISVEEAVGITLDDVDPLVVVTVVLSVGVDVVVVAGVVVEIEVVAPVADATIPKSYKSYLQKSRQTKSGAKIRGRENQCITYSLQLGPLLIQLLHLHGQLSLCLRQLGLLGGHHLGHTVIHVHGSYPATQAFTGSGGILDQRGLKVWVGHVPVHQTN